MLMDNDTPQVFPEKKIYIHEIYIHENHATKLLQPIHLFRKISSGSVMKFFSRNFERTSSKEIFYMLGCYYLAY